MKALVLALLITGFAACAACAAQPTVTEERRPGGISVIRITAADGWLEVDLGRSATISRAIVSEGWDRVRRFVLQARIGGVWQPVTTGTTLGMFSDLSFEPVTARVFRLNIMEATEVPTIWEFQLFSPTQ